MLVLECFLYQFIVSRIIGFVVEAGVRVVRNGNNVLERMVISPLFKEFLCFLGHKFHDVSQVLESNQIRVFFEIFRMS